MFAEVIGNGSVAVWYFLNGGQWVFPYIDWQDYYSVAF